MYHIIVYPINIYSFIIFIFWYICVISIGNNCNFMSIFN